MKQNGFTLVEIAIVMIIIGLLIGGILGGMAMIENARNNATIQFMKNVGAVMYNFRTVYGQLPGDISDISIIPNCTALPCARPGNGDGWVRGGGAYSQSAQSSSLGEGYGFWPPSTSAYTDIETFVFWQHLLAAGMMENYGPVANSEFGVGQPMSPMDLGYRMYSCGGGTSGTIADRKSCGSLTNDYLGNHMSAGSPHPLKAISTSNMRSIDVKIDDGMPRQGIFGGFSQGSGSDCSTQDNNLNAEYNFAASSLKMCQSFYIYNF